MIEIVRLSLRQNNYLKKGFCSDLVYHVIGALDLRIKIIEVPAETQP